MTVDDRQCSECGSTEWNFILDEDYPESRRERDRTVKTVYACEECGASGRHFEHQDTGTEQFSGALR